MFQCDLVCSDTAVRKSYSEEYLLACEVIYIIGGWRSIRSD